jgi:hypothetical protein
VSIPSSSPSASHPQARRPQFLRPIRLSTFLLLTVAAGLLIALYAQGLREARLLDALSAYRNPRQEGLYDALDRPIALAYPDGATVEQVLKEIKKQTTKNPALPKIPNGVQIYVDPIGLQEAEKSMNSPVQRPPSADALTLGEHLRRVLEPLGLGYEVKSGFLMISAKESLEAPAGVDADPYLQYRDVLR